MTSSPASLSLNKLRAALAFHGLRTREAFEELNFKSRDAEARLTLREHPKGQLVRCVICLDESRLLSSGLEVFNELSLEGYPAVGYGGDHAQTTFEFQWIHPDGADWRISGQRVEGLLQRLASNLGERPTRARPASRSRAASMYSELVPAVFGRIASAA